MYYTRLPSNIAEVSRNLRGLFLLPPREVLVALPALWDEPPGHGPPVGLVVVAAAAATVTPAAPLVLWGGELVRVAARGVVGGSPHWRGSPLLIGHLKQ